MKKNHWYKHDANDWLADVELRRCSLKARGLLEDLMCMAHNTEPYGHIDIGCHPSDQEWVKELAMTVRCHHKECSTAWQELVKRRRIAFDKDGNAYIERMVKEHAYSLRQSNFGKDGGNPNISKTLKAPLKPDEKESKNKKESEKRAPKKAYGEFKNVKLSKEEAGKLIATHGKAKLIKGVEVLDTYIQTSGKRYKDHYACLKATSWVWERVAAPSATKPKNGENFLLHGATT